MASMTYYKTLVNCIYDDDFDGFCAFLDTKGVVVDEKDESGATALHFAASCGRQRFVEELLKHGADPNISDNDNWYSLGLAAKEGFTDTCVTLLKYGADIDCRDMGQWTSLMWACYKGREDTAKVLVDSGADINAYGVHNVTSLMWATGRGYSNIAKYLISKGAKVTLRDRFGTTALIWAARKGDYEVAKLLIEKGASVDSAGMYCWTPIIVATMGNFVKVVELLIENKANVNATDKDGCSPLTIACRDGYYDIVVALVDGGAYINVQDKTRDSTLIYAVKNGHRAIVEFLIKRYADCNMVGRDNKTAVFHAVERGSLPILKLVVDAKPNLDMPSKDGDTPLLRAVKYHNYHAVKMLMKAGAKVAVRDKRGDNPLHIALRARSRTITELLVSDVRNAHLLSVPNNFGETPYQIDYDDEKPIMHQIYGARAINSNADNENSLGYDLYSCALAAILSEPEISMPITIGLYAKWGSGKSFLLNKVMEEMKNFSRQWLVPMLEFQWLLAVLILHVTFIIGVTVTLITDEWLYGIIAFCSLSLLVYLWLLAIYYASTKLKVLCGLNGYLSHKVRYIKIVLQILFCHPPGPDTHESPSVVPVKYYFAHQSKVTASSHGENVIANIVGTLFDAIESDHGTIPTRLCRALNPKPVKSNSPWRWRKICCIPSFVVLEMNFICILTVCFIYFYKFDELFYRQIMNETTQSALITACAIFVGFCVASNLYSCSHMFRALMFSQRKHLQRSISALETVKSDGFMEVLRSEVRFMIKMIKCLDAFVQRQSRMVIVVDGLDSCEQDKVLLVLDTVNVLFADADSPFIIFLSIDPFVITKMIEVNSRKLLSEANVGGHEYLRNMVQLPFYLQNSGLRRVKVAQKISQQRKSFSNQIAVEKNDEQNISRRPSFESGLNNDKLKLSSNGNNLSSQTQSHNLKSSTRKLKLSDSVASSIASNLNKAGGAQDLTHMLCADDYFSEINPRSMRRLMNVACVTGRLLKSFQIDFNWYHLASWVNITEQWPYRTTCLILYHDAHEETIDDSMTLKALYDKIRPYLPISKDVESLLEFDRDEKKFNVFLQYHVTNLQVSDLRIFLPFTINLDPHIKRIIKEKQLRLEDSVALAYNGTNDYGLPWLMGNISPQSERPWAARKNVYVRRDGNPRAQFKPIPQGQLQYPPATPVWNNPTTVVTGTPYSNMPNWGWMYDNVSKSVCTSQFSYAEDLPNVRLLKLNVEGVCDLLISSKEFQNSPHLERYLATIRENNINGTVIFYCELDELKKALNMTFGDWELFKMLILVLREQQLYTSKTEETNNKSFKHSGNQQLQPSTNYHQERKGSYSKTNASNPEQDVTDNKSRSISKQQSDTEKQITLEDQLICGALQTLNEEACEDVLEETEEPKSKASTRKDSDSEHTFFDDPTSDSEEKEQCSRNSQHVETEVIILKNTSESPPRWTAIVPTDDYFKSEVGDLNTDTSACSTPTLRRKKPNSESVFKKIRSRPSSLLMAKPDDVDEILTLEERKAAHAAIVRSFSIDDANLKRGAYRNMLLENDPTPCSISQTLLNALPLLTVTATSTDICNSTDEEDESTPLVSPQDNDYNSYSLEEIAQQHSQSREYRSSAESLGAVCALTYVDEKGFKSASLGKLKRIFQTGSSTSVDAKYKWSDSETAV